MKNKFLWIFLAVLLVGVLLVGGQYNGLVAGEENVKKAWAQVETVYQRRLDLIPNLVQTVKGYAKHERETLDSITNARARISQVNITSDVVNDPATLAKFQDMQGALTSVLTRLLAVSERYPELKANQNFLALQSQLEGTENRISVERNRYNEAAQEFNTKRRIFPASITANLFGFKEKAYFQADPLAQKAPSVEF